eukprot:GDKI01041429.1.p1 GENE.GDKI01041429.1~~GDKI01041429.1.p1  ORF type:complete len:372 (+),score=71.80 GDKI01041429.1:420-1535(+)
MDNFSEQAKRIKQSIKNYELQLHVGWGNQYAAAVEANMYPHVNALTDKYPSAKIVCTGHSMGGAMANLCGADYKGRWPHKDVQVYTFGSPRIFSPDLAVVVGEVMGKGKVWRIVNGADIATQMPPEKTGYRHMGGEVWYVAGKRNICCCGESKQCSSKLPYWRWTTVEHSLYYLDVEFGQCLPFVDNYSPSTFDDIDPDFEQKVLTRARARFADFTHTTLLDAAAVPLYMEDQDGGDGGDGGGTNNPQDWANWDPKMPSPSVDGLASELVSDRPAVTTDNVSVLTQRRLRGSGLTETTNGDRDGNNLGNGNYLLGKKPLDAAILNLYNQYAMHLSETAIQYAVLDEVKGPQSVAGKLAKWALEASEFCVLE